MGLRHGNIQTDGQTDRQWQIISVHNSWLLPLTHCCHAAIEHTSPPLTEVAGSSTLVLPAGQGLVAVLFTWWAVAITALG